jgi:hypothetical protein
VSREVLSLHRAIERLKPSYDALTKLTTVHSSATEAGDLAQRPGHITLNQTLARFQRRSTGEKHGRRGFVVHELGGDLRGSGQARGYREAISRIADRRLKELV